MSKPILSKTDLKRRERIKINKIKEVFEKVPRIWDFETDENSISKRNQLIAQNKVYRLDDRKNQTLNKFIKS